MLYILMIASASVKLILTVGGKHEKHRPEHDFCSLLIGCSFLHTICIRTYPFWRKADHLMILLT